MIDINIGPITINLMFLGIAAGVVAVIGLVIRAFRARRRREHGIAQEYAGLTNNRETMWTAVREAYEQFRSTRQYAPTQIEDLLAIVGPPPDVGDRDV